MHDGGGARGLALIERHGWNATSFQTLAPGYDYFFDGDDACVAYVDTGAAWVAAGAPIASGERLAAVADAFVRAASAAGRRCCFFATEERLQRLTAGALATLPIGEQPSWEPFAWSATLAGSRSLREQLRRARAKGVRVRVATRDELTSGPLGDALAALTTRWLATREMAPMGFLVQLTPGLWPAHRRCFVAEQDGRLVGFAGVVPVPARCGWFIENLVRMTSSPNGTAELLVDAVMREAERSGITWLTLGLAPLAGDTAPALRLARRHMDFLYDFEGLWRFKAKLRPQQWSPIFLSYPAGQGAIWSVVDALRAFSGVSFVRFGLRTLGRGPAVIVRSLPVGFALAAVVTLRLRARPAPSLVWALGEVALALGLWQLARRPTAARFAWLIGATTAAAVAGSVDLALDHSVATALRAGVIALLALSAVVLRGARSRQQLAGG